MNIGGVTFYGGTNYGTNLQAYALQQIITNRGYNHKIIDYKRDIANMDNNDRRVHSLLKRVFMIAVSPYRIPLNRVFLSFRKKYLHVTEPIYGNDNLAKLNECFDAFICGSDQIWRNNVSLNKLDPFYYLSFTDKPKIAYAASIGTNKVEHEEMYEKYLPTFSAISVREESARNIIQKYFNQPVETVLDPTLLLSRKEWDRLLTPAKISKPYILEYVAYYSSNVECFVRKLQKQTGYHVVKVAGHIPTAFKQRAFATPTPNEWLGLVDGAAYIVTNSFHGTAFSVNFEKEVFVVTDEQHSQGSSVRMRDFMSGLGLLDRVYETCPSVISIDKADYSYAREILRREREKSLSFLYNSLAKAAERNK